MSLTCLSADKGGVFKEVNGPTFKPKKTDRSYSYAGALKINDNYYVFGRNYRHNYGLGGYRTVPADIKIYKLDGKMNVKDVTTIEAEFYNKYVNSFKMVKLGEHLCAFFYFNNRKSKRQVFFAQLFNPKSFKPIGNPIKLAETMITKKDMKSGCFFDVDVTDDDLKLMVTMDRTNNTLSKRERKAAEQMKNHSLTYWLFNNELKQIGEGKNIKLGKGQTEIIDQSIDKKGNICLLGFERKISDKNAKKREKASKPKDKKKSKNDDDEEEEEEEKTDENVNKLVMKIIHPDGTFKDLVFAENTDFYSARLILNNNTGNVAVVGLVTSGKYGAAGIFTQQVNPETFEILAERKEMFGTEFTAEMDAVKPETKKKKGKEKNSDKPEKKKRKSKRDYVPDLVKIGDVFYNDSNELYVTCQKFYIYVEVHTTTTNGRTTTTYVTHYVYNDIYTFKIDQEGKIVNFDIVFYYLNRTSPIPRAFSTLYDDGSLYLITRQAGARIKLENSSTSLTEFKNSKEYSRSRYLINDFIRVSNHELVHILGSRRKMVFSSIAINDKR
ncbi:MAG TPA: hypothetical protein VGF79_10270 [Bacteroidia bacterium]